MNNLTPTEYFKDLFETSSESKYFKVIRAVRLDSPGSYFSKKGVSGSKFTTIIIYALVRTDKDSFRTGTYIIDNFDEDNETIKRNDPPVPGKIGKYLRVDTDHANSVDNNFSKKELDTFELDSNKQLEYINIRIKRDFTTEGPWSIIQDPWDPTVFVDFIPGPPGEPIKSDDNIVKTTPVPETPPEPVVTLPVVLPPIKLQSDFNFDVKKENTFVITSGNNGNLVSLPDGTIVDLGELTVVKKEDPTNPEIIRLITPYIDEIVELDSEYTDENFAGLEEQPVFLEPSGDINIDMLNDIKGVNPENFDEELSTDSDSKYPLSEDKYKNVITILNIAKNSGITNKYALASILAICRKESGLVPRSEASYSGTSEYKIKSIFSKFKKYTDSEVNKIKKNNKKFFDIIYGNLNGNSSDEGHKYRGRGFNQITFKGNYELYKNITGYDIVSDPDSLNKVEIAGKCLVEFFKTNFKKAGSSNKDRYNFTDINSFTNLKDAIGAFYHANAGFGTPFSVIEADSTGGRAKAFKYAGYFDDKYKKEISK